MPAGRRWDADEGERPDNGANRAERAIVSAALLRMVPAARMQQESSVDDVRMHDTQLRLPALVCECRPDYAIHWRC